MLLDGVVIGPDFKPFHTILMGRNADYLFLRVFLEDILNRVSRGLGYMNKQKPVFQRNQFSKPCKYDLSRYKKEATQKQWPLSLTQNCRRAANWFAVIS